MAEQKIIAVDIDDVVAGLGETVRIWTNNVSGKELTPQDYDIRADYWGYYERVWEMHDLQHLSLAMIEDDLVRDAIEVPLIAGAQFAIKELAKTHRLIFITSRDPRLEEATRKWFAEHVGHEAELFFAKAGNNRYVGGSKSKGELCRALGAFLLIDDNVEHVQSALDNGVEAILFGNYGWQPGVPEGAIRKENWSDVLEYLNDRQ